MQNTMSGVQCECGKEDQMDEVRRNQLESVAVDEAKVLQLRIRGQVDDMVRNKVMKADEAEYLEDRIRFLIGHL